MAAIWVTQIIPIDDWMAGGHNSLLDFRSYVATQAAAAGNPTPPDGAPITATLWRDLGADGRIPSATAPDYVELTITWDPDTTPGRAPTPDVSRPANTRD